MFTRKPHTALSPEEAADRLAIRELFDAYAHCADRRDAAGQQSLFAPDCVFAVFMEGPSSPATYTLKGRDALAPVFAELHTYDTTTHFNGQLRVEFEGASRAKGEGYCLAHHLWSTDCGERKIMVASLRYRDTYAKLDGMWYFQERELVLDWEETRTCTAE